MHRKQQFNYDTVSLDMLLVVKFWCFYVVVAFLFRLGCSFVDFDVAVAEHRKTQ